MAAPLVTIYLYAPYILLSGSTSNVGITVIGGNTQVGVIEKVYLNCHLNVGDKVLFSLDEQITINDGTNEFFMVKQDSIYYSEPPAV